MCVILDVHILHKVFPEPDVHHKPIYRALADGSARIVYGGYIIEEYRRTAKFWKFLKLLDQSGAARQVSSTDVARRTAHLHASGVCRSNDSHVLALAQISGARLLCSDDDDLCFDFRDRRILRNPRGSVYRKASHAPLIRRHCRLQNERRERKR